MINDITIQGGKLEIISNSGNGILLTEGSNNKIKAGDGYFIRSFNGDVLISKSIIDNIKATDVTLVVSGNSNGILLTGSVSNNEIRAGDGYKGGSFSISGGNSGYGIGITGGSNNKIRAGDGYLMRIDTGTLTINESQISTAAITGGTLSLSGGTGIFITGSNNEIRAGDSYLTKVSKGNILITSGTIKDIKTSGGALVAYGNKYGIFIVSTSNKVRAGDVYLAKADIGDVAITSTTISSVTIQGGSLVASDTDYGFYITSANNEIRAGDGYLAKADTGNIAITSSTIKDIKTSGGAVIPYGSNGIFIVSNSNKIKAGDGYLAKVGIGDVTISSTTVSSATIQGGSLVASNINTGVNISGYSYNEIMAGDGYLAKSDTGNIAITRNTINDMKISGGMLQSNGSAIAGISITGGTLNKIKAGDAYLAKASKGNIHITSTPHHR